jgi:hypothetical protein
MGPNTTEGEPLAHFSIQLVVEGLLARREEIEQAVHVHIQEAVPTPRVRVDGEYDNGLRAAIAATLDYSFRGLQAGPGWNGPIPAATAAQARRAARAGVGLGTVLRRVVAGHGLLGDFVFEQVEACDLDSHAAAVVDHARHIREVLLERLIGAIEREYNLERSRSRLSPENWRAEVVQRLLAGEAVNSGELAMLGYQLQDAWHLGLVLTGEGAERFVWHLKDQIDCEMLLAPHGDGTLRVWLGRQRQLSVAELERASSKDHPNLAVAVGEPGRGLDGWRQTHTEAQLAHVVALREPQGFTRFIDAVPEIAMLENEPLARLLMNTYISPLNSLRKGGQPARETLRCYLAHNRNVSSTAVALKVVRRTVENRLREIEGALGRPLHTSLTGLELALRLEQLGYTPGR